MYTRREFITKFSTAISAIAAISPVILAESCAPSTIPNLTSNSNNPGSDGRIPVDVSDLTDANPMKLASGLTGSNGAPILVTRLAAADFRALSALCTHQSCQVNSTLSNGYILCSCHLSHFALDGSVLQGPAATPLFEYNSIYDSTNHQLRIKLS